MGAAFSRILSVGEAPARESSLFYSKNSQRQTNRNISRIYSTRNQKMFGFSKSLKSLNLPQTVIAKNQQDGTRKRYAQVMQPCNQRFVKKANNTKQF